MARYNYGQVGFIRAHCTNVHSAVPIANTPNSDEQYQQLNSIKNKLTILDFTLYFSSILILFYWHHIYCIVWHYNILAHWHILG